MEWTSVFLAFIILFVSLSLFRRWLFQSKYSLPPGPWAWPIIGYLPYPVIGTHLHLGNLAKKYGGLFGMYVGNRYVVVLDDWKSVKESFARDAFLSRPPGSTQIDAEQPSLIDMNEPQGWKVQRKFQINSFRLLGSLTKDFERYIVANATDAINQLKSQTGRDVNTHHAVELALNNITFKLLYGKGFEPNHPFIRLLTDYDNAVVHIWGVQTLTVFIPWLFTLYEFTPKMRHARKIIAEMDRIVESEIEEHRKTLHLDDPRDYIDHYLIEMNRPGSDPSYTLPNLVGNVKVLLEASSETTNVSLSWFLLCMAEHQDIQQKVFQEIQNIFGVEVEPQYEYRNQLPYTLATLQESMRWKNLLHLNVFREVSEDSKLSGYDIPKGTILIHNLRSHFRHPNLWKRPDEFDPTRFLSKDGKSVETPEYHIPFSYGNRMCPGDKLAKISLFIFAMSVVQRYQIFPSKAGVSFKENPIFNNHPVHPYVRIELRQ